MNKRVTVKPQNPNPLFEKWLTEWRDTAKQNDSKMQHCFSLALKSLKKYPIPLESGKDCKILKGFGEKLCKMLDDKLMQWKTSNKVLTVDTGLLATSNNSNEPIVENGVLKNKISTPEKNNIKKSSPKKSNSKEYIPKLGSGAYAILITLYDKSLEPGFIGYLTKPEIIQHGQHLCNVSFTKPGPDTRYTGWSSMKVLLEKKLITKESNPAKFRLTDESTALAEKLYIQHKINQFQKEQEYGPVVASVGNKITKHNLSASKKHLPDYQQSTSTSSQSSAASSSNTTNNLLVVEPKKNTPLWHKSTSSSSQSSTSFETVIFAPNSFEIFLLVDTQELNSSKGDSENDPILLELKKLNVNYEVRNLKVGDYAWICRDQTSTELILPYIVERKRMDDLGHSIKDGRYYEQKFRLQQCGIQNLIYLVENFGKNEHCGLPITTLYQAATNTLVHNNFSVKFTDNGQASCEYLACLTNFFEKSFKSKTLVGCLKEDLQPLDLNDDLVQVMHFKEFNKNSSKTKHITIKEMFIKQLLQIKGMSVDKALAIVDKYPTPKLLKLRYNEVDEYQGEKFLANVQFGPLKKNIGPMLSKIVYQLFCGRY